ncbi:MAG: ABC transporter ATP-binding protein [Azorhizobium sp. 32-67-21]|nr:MAG: ABC transporter ATP-binding protein [Rhizobiales bacterium 12-68-15]OYX90010.1 MAG: ABC transporter ATP-binding protein [Azorhizobium sp. 32-67-21]
MNRLRDILPVLRLFLGERRLVLAMGAGLAALTVLAGMALLGISGWFITATALAGLVPATAMAFDVFAPAAAIRLLALTRTGARYGERLVTHDAALGLLAGLRERLFRGWAQPGAARALRARPARLLFRLTADIDALDSLYLRIAVPLVASLAALLVLALTLGWVSGALALAVVAVTVLAGVVFPLLAGRRSAPAARRRALAIEALRARVIDLVAGQTELAMAGRLMPQRVAISRADARVARADDALNRADVAAGAVLATGGALTLAGTLMAVAFLMERGTLGAPVAVLCLLVPLAALEPFAALRRGMLEWGRTALALRRIAPRLAAAPEAKGGAAPLTDAAIRLSGVSARHHSGAPACLRAVHLAVEPGARVAVVGSSGAGKSTLLAVLAGELAPEEGMAQALPSTLLPQATELFQDSIADNLRLADPDADEARLWQVLEAAGLAATVRALPQGLGSAIGEGGLGLSGGQARRLAMARLFLRTTPLWLLDEPTDGLDPATARDVLARLSLQAEGRTLLIATHIRREAELADRLIVMSNGRIVARHRRGEEGFAAVLSALRPD